MKAPVFNFSRALQSRQLAQACVCVAALFFAWLVPSTVVTRDATTEAPGTLSEREADESLARAARESLGGRDGAVLVLDAQTGRVRAAVNESLIYGEAFPPGSTVKPFTALAALRSRALSADTRLLCPGRYEHAGFAINCTHPRLKPPLTPPRALAYSCNHFFARVGEELNADDLLPVLAAYGFGAGDNRAPERASSRLPRRDEWRTQFTLGDTPQLLVTPAQLGSAYAALANGGKLFAARRGGAHDAAVGAGRVVEIGPAHRALLLEGMRGAVAYGTADRAGLASLSTYVFGKTGTATPRDDFRTTHGWFVGLAADHEAAATGGAAAQVAPESVRLVVVAFLRRGTGAESASVARPVFEEFARLDAAAKLAARKSVNAVAAAADVESRDSLDSPDDGTHVRVRLVRGDVTRTLPLEEYVFGVLAAEGSVETEPEALKALAVVARSYALRHAAGRHARDGHDLCDTTHCQRYTHVADESARPEFYEAARRAVAETAGETLRDNGGGGRVAETYFSAACGGAGADVRDLWGVNDAPPQLRGGRDEFCANLPTSAWTDTVSDARLAAALRADKRTDVGARVREVRVLRRDHSGRAALLSVEGDERRRVVRGWDFKIVVGRSLGWNVLKSTRFEVTRAGSSFVFRGAGFGHGLGLCQAGAHVLARRGASYRDILKRYLPGVSVSAERATDTGRAETLNPSRPEESVGATGSVEAAERGVDFRPATFRRADTESFGVASRHPVMRAGYVTSHAPSRVTLSGGNFRVSYPAGAGRADAEAALRALEAARADVGRRLATAGLAPGGVNFDVELFVHDTTGDFVGATRQPAWVAAATRGRRIESQPLATLRRRGVLASALRHEYVHAVVETLGRGRAPRWLAEGLAAHVAGEGASLTRGALRKRIGVDELERRLGEHLASPAEMRALYAAAYAEVAALIKREGEAGAWRRVLAGGGR